MIWNRERIIEEAEDVISGELAGMKITVRQLHYQLVGRGMTNDHKHYKKVVAAMEKARWEDMIPFEAFVDHERDVMGETSFLPVDLDDEIIQAKEQIRSWMTHYARNRWENQEHYVEVWIEKKTLQGICDSICRRWDVALFPCKGYPSLTALNEAKDRFLEAEDLGFDPVIIYAGDHDPSGDDIPRSIQENLYKMGVGVDLDRIALTEEQVLDKNLPAAPTKKTDSRTAGWDGIGQVELDALHPRELQQIINDSIEGYFDHDIHQEVLDQEEEERRTFQLELKNFIQNL